MMYAIMAHTAVQLSQTAQWVTELLVRWELPFINRRKMYFAGSYSVR